MRVLLIEDDAVLQAVMLRSLSDAGHRVDVAGHAQDAAHYWGVQTYDVVLLDLNLPLNAQAHHHRPMACNFCAMRDAEAIERRCWC